MRSTLCSRVLLILVVAVMGSGSVLAQVQPDRVQDLTGWGTDYLIQGANANDQAGTSVAFGDLNRDGLDDLIVGAPNVDGPGGQDVGAVYVFYGRKDAAGNAVHDLAKQPPDVTILGDDPNDFIGAGVAVGDINGDGRLDLVTSGWGVDVSTRSNCGGVYVIYGRPGGFSTLIDLNSTPADLTVYGRYFFDEMGRSLAVGDINHDGIDDILTGAPDEDPGARQNAGVLHVIFGRTTYPANAVIDLVGGLSDITVNGRYAFNHLGSSVTVGDFNNDQIDDMIFGARFASQVKTQAGETYVVYGRTTWSTPYILDLGSGGLPDITFVGRWGGDNLSTALAVGDVNNDGRDDLVTTAYGSGPGWPGPVRNNAGEINVVFGATFPPRHTWDFGVTPPDIRVMGRAAGDRLGWGAAVVDLDGDGIRDFIAAAPEASPLSRTQAGTVFYFRGGSSTAVTTIDLSQASADWEIQGGAPAELTGQGAMAVGDFNGDGHPDLAMGTPGATQQSKSMAGGVRILYGGFLWALDPPRVATNMRIQIRARGFPNTYRLGAAAFSAYVGIPIGTRTFPLDPDTLFFTSLVAPHVFANYAGFISSTGDAVANLKIPDIGALAGWTVYSSFVLLANGAPSGTAAVGNRLHITFVP